MRAIIKGLYRNKLNLKLYGTVLLFLSQPGKAPLKKTISNGTI